jgi:hypothetical protein
MRRLTDGEAIAAGLLVLWWLGRRRQGARDVEREPEGRVSSITVDDAEPQGRQVTAYPDGGPVSMPGQVDG